MERNFEERARVSAPVMRTFINICHRWQLTSRQEAQLLACDEATLQSWSSAAQQREPLALETTTLLRISVVLGVFADLRRLLTAIPGAQEERTWLLGQQHFAPFNGRTPLEVLSGDFDEQMKVRRHLAAIAANADPAADWPLQHTLDADYNLLDAHGGKIGIQGVCFDGFGTLVEIMDKRRPFQLLIDGESSNSLARYAMEHPIGLRELAQQLSNSVSDERLAELEADLSAELNSVRQRPGMDRVWRAVQRAGLRTGICSNLALPYREPLLAQIPGEPDALILSFQVGTTKPRPEIYHLVCSQVGLEPGQMLFVGDAMIADVMGPRTIGAFSMPIDEFERSFAAGASFYAPSPVAELFQRLIAAKAN